ncbi:MAG TPA: Uma2 family endonuclease [Thermoanaerobaculia bacterium]|jgi:hypothetical protein
MDTFASKMEARASTVDAPRAVRDRERPASPGAKDPFRLGYRWRRTTTPDGREDLEQIPLTPEDLVYPQEGDQVSQGLPHFSFLHPQADAIRRHLEKRPGIRVTSDVVLVLRHDGKTCGPDVAVIEGDVDTSKITGAVGLAAVGGRLAFAFEAVSTSEKEIEDKDLEKNVVRYAREGVEEYFTVYPVVERRVRDLVGRRLEKGVYVEISPDAEGRVFSQKLGLFFQIDAASEELVVVDAETGERLLISDEEEAGRRKAQAALQVSEMARRQAEERAEKEAEARRQAEALGLRRGVEDLCAVLGLAWDAERRARVDHMSPSRLEALRQHLIKEKSWPEQVAPSS